MSATETLHVLQLSAQDFMGLRAVEVRLTPEGALFTGENGSGKTSALSILEAAFCGKAGEPKAPIRDGTYHAEIGVVVGVDGAPRFKVTKEWDNDGKPGKLIVTGVDGARFASPQKMLDELYNTLTFDLGAFLSPKGAQTPDATIKKQVEMLLAACPLDINLDMHAAERKKLYDSRTALKRDVDTYAVKLRTTTRQDVPERVAVDALRASLRDASAAAATLRADRDRVTGIDKELETLRKRFEELRTERAQIVERVTKTPVLDVGALETQLAAAERQNEEAIRAATANQQYDALMKDLGDARKKVETLTAGIEALDKQKVEALARAKFPVEGMGLDETLGITLTEDGRTVPFLQVNTARRIDIAFRILARLNGSLKIARIADGNDLDHKTLALIARTARVLERQLFVERIAADASLPVLEFSEGSVTARPAAPAAATT